MWALILLSTFLVVNGYPQQYINDQGKDHLEVMAGNIMQEMNKAHLPSESGQSGVHNAPLHHFINGAYAQKYLKDEKGKTENIKVTVGVKGYRFVSVEQNGKVVNVSTAFGVCAGAIYKIVTNDQMDTDLDESTEVNEIEELLEPLKYQYVDLDPVENRTGTIGVVLGQKAKFGMKVKQGNKETKAKVLHGYIVGAKTNVTKSGY